ncbi:hypothetical protein P7K49_026070 [Saguinus oedipus]|uniref:Uncharacterized protein n=1 Tax=Saguinus oedipus TaxID=9490 RepID=A0ABQ9UJ17_SAGOE|nr:hypothetical protein P7K49_026070 [Saguinus oedipus]
MNREDGLSLHLVETPQRLTQDTLLDAGGPWRAIEGPGPRRRPVCHAPHPTHNCRAETRNTLRTSMSPADLLDSMCINRKLGEMGSSSSASAVSEMNVTEIVPWLHDANRCWWQSGRTWGAAGIMWSPAAKWTGSDFPSCELTSQHHFHACSATGSPRGDVPGTGAERPVDSQHRTHSGLSGSESAANVRDSGCHPPWHTQAVESARRLVPQERTRVSDLPPHQSCKAASSLVIPQPSPPCAKAHFCQMAKTVTCCPSPEDGRTFR